MPVATRFYIDKDGGHVRVIDLAELDQDKAQKQAEKLLKKGEEINSLVSITVDESHELS
jgi:hypothetical protein